MNKIQLIGLCFFFTLSTANGNADTERSVASVQYIPYEDNSMFVLVGNSIVTYSLETLAIMLGEALKLPDLDVHLQYDGVEIILDDKEKKSLAIALMRLVMKDSLGLPKSMNMNLQSSKELKMLYGIDFCLYIKDASIARRICVGKNLVKIASIKNSDSENSEKDSSALFMEGTYISKEFVYLLHSFVEKKSPKSEIKQPFDSKYDAILAPMRYYSESALLHMYDFTYEFVNKKIRVASIFSTSNESSEYASMISRKVLTEKEQKALISALVRSTVLTDSLMLSRITDDGYSVSMGAMYRSSQLFVFFEDRAFSVEYAVYPDYFYQTGVVQLKKYYLKTDNRLQETEHEILSDIFNGLPKFQRKVSYFSPELYYIVEELTEKYAVKLPPTPKKDPFDFGI